MFPSFGSPARARAQSGGKNSSKNKNSNGNDSNQQKTSPAKQCPNNNNNGNNYYDLTLSPPNENSHGNSPTKYGASKPSAIAKRKKKKQTNNNNNAKRRLLGNSKPSPNSPKKKKKASTGTTTAIDLSQLEDSPSPTGKNPSRREIHAVAALRRANNDNNGNNNAVLVDSKPPPLLTGGGSSAAQPPQELPNPQPPSMVDRVRSGARSMLQSLLPAVSQYFTGRPQPASPPLPPTASPSEQRRTNSEEWLAHSERTNQQSAPPNVGIDFQETNLELDGDYVPSDYKVYTNGHQSIALATKLLQDNDVLLFTLDIKFGIFAALSSHPSTWD